MEYNGFRIVTAQNLIGYEIKHTGKGSLGKSLQGSFTSVGAASNAIKSYLATRKEKGDVDGQTDASDRGEQVHSGPSNRRKSTINS